MAEDTAKIKLRKNVDGSTTKVVVKKVAKKVKLKKPPVKKEKKQAPAAGSEAKAGAEKKDKNQASASSPKKRKIFVAKKKNKKDEGGMPPSQKALNYHKKQQHNQFKHKYKREEVLEEEKKIEKLESSTAKNDVNEAANVPDKIEVPETISIKNLAQKLNLKAATVLKKLFSLGVMNLTVNDTVDAESAVIVAGEFNCEVKVISLAEQSKVEAEKGREKDYVARAPVVTVMGHVDHGKTALLDAIRDSNVIAGESGGITQHIGAYKVKNKKGDILFIDTPGHAAFSEMRARGADVTDIVILVVSAVDGVKPQTVEAINHTKAAGVPFIVAVNKMDLDGADPEKVKKELSEQGVLSEEWGGEVIFQNISAVKKTGIQGLLEAVLLQADMLELKGNPKVKAMGYVLESKVVKGKGHVVSVIIKNGTLKKGDAYICGKFPGKIRAMFDDQGQSLQKAGPSSAVEIIGLSGSAAAGELFQVVADEKEAKKIAERREQLEKENKAQNVKTVNMSNLFDTLQDSKITEYKVLIKADVYGSVEAIKGTLQKMQNNEVRISVMHAATGAINEHDINLAATSDALVIGFKVKPNNKARKLAEQAGVVVKQYNVIYEIIDDMKEALAGMLKSEEKEKIIAGAEVKDVFNISGVGKIAGCLVTEGKVKKSNKVKLYRDNTLQYSGDIASLRRYKDEVKEVASGTECGVAIKDYQDIKSGDYLEFYEVEQVKRTLELDNQNE